ncbi:hypothetical protein KIW84_070453 [Lathyrus oleraceus]|uniref:Integrase catalytic domain-containing protein n=1 Tax=Pisum sativum TaxID=3888 RepID=A0A9D4VGV3_PEA|nr:hypothetical protein KIW84_070453 [Pisum sativum]
MVCKLNGMPRSMVSDRDPVFLSNFWRKLFRLSGTKLRMSTAYHPQSDGKTEIVSKVLQQYFRLFMATLHRHHITFLNKVADTLSRVQCLAISIPHFDFLQKFKEHLAKDGEFQTLVSQVQAQPENHEGFQVLKGLVFYKGRFFIPNNSPLKHILLEELLE